VKKTVIAPGQGVIESDDLDEPQTSLAVATHRRDCVHVECNGLVYPDGDVRTQTRELFGLVAKLLGEFDGSPNDLVKLRWYVEEDEYDPATRGAMHEVQAEFVDRPHYPASCVVTTPAVPVGGALLELDATATVPTDDWTVETISE
jgi:enamine deaminase RidA (YjgF/YER057c/UK114 family)